MPLVIFARRAKQRCASRAGVAQKGPYTLLKGPTNRMNHSYWPR